MIRVLKTIALILRLFSHFVPNITLGAPIIASLRPHTEAYFGMFRKQ